MHLKDLLKQLGQEMGLGTLEMDEDNTCRLVFDDIINVDLEVTDDNKILWIYSVIGVLPVDNREKFYERLLSANLFGKETGDAAFAVDTNTKEVLLITKVNLEKIDFQDFINLLELFVDRTEFWIDEIKRTAEQSLSQDAQISDIGAGMLRA
ncbi:type III secretion system chaperone [Desulfothermus sp.]